jgi:hypothetical protein
MPFGVTLLRCLLVMLLYLFKITVAGEASLRCTSACPCFFSFRLLQSTDLFSTIPFVKRNRNPSRRFNTLLRLLLPLT